MPNPIKYTAGTETLALNKGNFYIGTGDVGKGSSDVTGYYQGPSPESGGYVVYLNKSGVPGDLSYHSATNDNQLISFTNNLFGTSFTSATQCLNYYATQTDKVCFNRDYEPIVTNGLTFLVDPGFTPSYPSSGTTLYGLSGTNNGTLNNGTSYTSSNGGTFIFDGTDDTITFSDNSAFQLSGPGTVSFWCRFVTTTQRCVGPQMLASNTLNGGAWAIAIRANRTVNFEIDPAGAIDDTPFTLSDAELPLNTWGMLTCVSTTTGCDGYWNGIYRGSISYPFPPPSSYSGTNSFRILDRGTLGPMMIYNRTLTSTEVLQNFNAQKSRFGL
jgi:hypothetical protein